MRDLAADLEECRKVAHDLSNQILVVQGNLDLLGMKLPGEAKLRCHLELASNAAERCRALTERLRTITGKPEPDP